MPLQTEYRINGKQVSSSKISKVFKSLPDAIEKELKQNLKKVVSKVRCPQHKKIPNNVRFTGSLLRNNLMLKANCCCEDLQNAINSKLSQS